MKLESINVGRPREVEWQGKLVRTSFFKAPVMGQVRVTTLNIEGDQQSDLSVHGGIEKAVYAYPSEHYSFWGKELPGVELPWGSFGENLTTRGVSEDGVYIGDRLRVGSAEFMVTQPRMPCYKMEIHFGRSDIVKRFMQSRRTGFYLAVLREGETTVGDSIEFLARDEQRITVADLANLYVTDAPDQDLLHRIIEHPALPARWRDYFRKRSV
jgi:MOSC domain-containing protein YiiM